MNRERGKVRYRTRTLESKRTTTRGGALCRRRAGERGAASGVGYVLAHVRNCGHLSRKQEEGRGGRWREMVRDEGETTEREKEKGREEEREFRGEGVSPRSRG